VAVEKTIVLPLYGYLGYPPAAPTQRPQMQQHNHDGFEALSSERNIYHTFNS
jgi:hypothetical protein